MHFFTITSLTRAYTWSFFFTNRVKHWAVLTRLIKKNGYIYFRVSLGSTSWNEKCGLYETGWVTMRGQWLRRWWHLCVISAIITRWTHWTTWRRRWFCDVLCTRPTRRFTASVHSSIQFSYAPNSLDAFPLKAGLRLKSVGLVQRSARRPSGTVLLATSRSNGIWEMTRHNRHNGLLPTPTFTKLNENGIPNKQMLTQY